MKKIFFNKALNKAEDFAKQVEKENYGNLTDEELKTKFNGTLINTSAAIKEAVKRITGLTLFNSQIKTAYLLYMGNIVELPTGEGKTLAAVMAALLFFKDMRKVSVLVFNDYLAARDGTDNKKIYEFFGAECGYITANTDMDLRKEIYKKDIVYISAKEQGFDYLRNFLAYNEQENFDICFDVAIIDEADSILIDESGVPLVLAGNADDIKDDTLEAYNAVKTLNSSDYGCNKAENQIWLEDSGTKKIEEYFKINNLYSTQNFYILTAVHTALEANFLLKKDSDYIVKNNNIMVIDESTGRIAKNRRFPDSLQHAVEIKENISFGTSTKIFNTITIQSFVEMYKTLSGMTGTAKSSAKEIWSVYGVNTQVVEAHIPCIRYDEPDRVYLTKEEKQTAVLNRIREANKKGQPVLLGTSSVAESEWYSKNLKDIKHSVLNAKNDEKEAEIIADAGKLGNVTISTNMAGRGVDIKLGGKDESEKEAVLKAGGLLVISSGINKSVRIDNQLKGRAGRQGDIGASAFYISIEDDNIKPFISEDKKSTLIEFVREAQSILEGQGAEARYMLGKYSIIIEEQRKVMNKMHERIIFSQGPLNFLQKNDLNLYNELLKKYPEEWINLAEKQILNYYSIMCFADYLSGMEDVRNGIHLVIVGGKNPLDEYNAIAINNFDEMQKDIKAKAIEALKTMPITENGIDFAAKGLIAAPSTWTYMVNENTSQFNRLPELLKMFSKKIKKSFSLTDYIDKKLNKS